MCVLGEDLKPGDVLLSPIPNAKVIVGSIHPFNSPNYMIIPRFCNTSFFVNENTLLPIKCDGKYMLLNTQRYEQLTNKAGIELVHEAGDFPTTPITIDPYILGIWFNHNHRTSNLMILPKSTVTVILFIQSFLDKFKIQHTDYEDYVIITDKRLLQHMKAHNLLFTSPSSSPPKVPTKYIFNNRSIREKFLAGFIDNNITDEIQIFDENLKNDIVYIAHSLGHLTATKHKNKVWYVTIMHRTDNEIQVHRNDFKMAKVPYNDVLCLGLIGGSMPPAFFLSDFTVL